MLINLKDKEIFQPNGKILGQTIKKRYKKK